MIIEKRMKIFIVLFLVSTVLFFWANLSSIKHQEDLTGFWVAPKSFLEGANLDSMIIYMSPPGSSIFPKKREVFMSMQEGDSFIVHDLFTADTSLRFGNLNAWYPCCTKYYNFGTPVLNKEIPKDLLISLDNGKMTIYKNDTIYGVLFKDCGMSHEAINKIKMDKDKNKNKPSAPIPTKIEQEIE